jgi:hypothetical protein
MRIFVFITALLFSLPGWSLNAHELPESAHTVGKGNTQLHLGLGQSSFGLSDNVDLRTSVVANFFGFNAQLKWAIIQDADQALSLEPMVWAEWPWASMGFGSYSAGMHLRHSMRVGEKGRLNLGTGAIYDRLKVALQFSDGWGGPDKGFGGDWWYSLTLYRTPLMYGHEATDISKGEVYDGWIFHGVRVPIIIGYEHMASERASFNSVIRFHPMNLVNGGGWWLEVHPTYVTRIGENARIAIGVNMIVPGNPMPIRDEGVRNYVDNAQSNLHPRFWEALLPNTPILPLPYIGAYWVF